MLTKYKLILPFTLRKLTLCASLFLLFFSHTYGQEFSFPNKRTRESLSFKSIKNLIIIPLFVNGKGPYNFVLDTGVGPMIITDPSIIDSLNFNALRKIKVSGLGLETVEAFVSQSISVKIGAATISRIPTAILKEDLFNLSGHLGLKIYGIIGFSFFNSFVVDVRYSENRIIFYDPDAKIKYRGTKIPIEIENLKPYVTAEVGLPEGRVKTKFLMDTGASHALSMEMLNGGEFPKPDVKIKANLGMTLSGQIKGYIGRIKELYIGKYTFKNVVAGFPDFKSISEKIDLTSRNGNIGADVLRKFDIQFNYRENFICIKPNSYSKQPFEHDMVGMVIYLDQNKYKKVIIGEIDEDSPAEKAGLCQDDEILSVNFSPVDVYTLNDLTNLFKSKSERNIILEIYRDNKIFFKVVKLEQRI
ncbi:aspartyl protease family protein [Pedobacter punctiformis]|uniref:Aspartyl protease family protein n=1 Tax=Pedobacter punctiformis TaxID=3004097 RepID=A0ABT4L5C5_9SPHI|nr:aspartyl protease family protein [Pedobacter sp. HCMS5-2]MCZ4243120.1 aspartyl protease family protein [Pedobacter sp. HCMS5-2]